MPVYCPPETTTEYERVAGEIAEERDEQVVQSVPERGVVTVVSSPFALDSETVFQLQRRLSRLGPAAGGFGIVTGVTPEAARKLYEPTGSDRNRHLIALREETRDWFLSDDDGEVLQTADVSVDALRERDGELASASLHLHGRPLHLYLDDGYVCGVPPTETDAAGEGERPYCVTADGEIDCPLTGERLSAAAFDVPNVFIDSCSSMLPTTDRSGLPVHVGMQLLRGADSLIGSYRQIDPSYHFALLHYTLVRAGYSTAERCYLLNETAHACGVERFPYVPFGRPNHALAAESGQYEWHRSGDDLRVIDADTRIIDLTIEDTTTPVYLRNRTDAFADAPIYYAAFEEDGQVRLLLYTWGPVRVDSLTIETGTSRYGNRRFRIVSDAVDNFRRAAELGLIDRKGRGQFNDLRNRIQGITEDDGRQSFDTNAYREVDERLDRITDGFRRIQRRIVDELQTGYTAYLSERYDETLASTGTGSDRTCPHCDGRVFTKRFGTAVGDAARARATCPTHGVVFDVPVRDGRPATAPALSVAPTDPERVTVGFENHRDVPLETTLFPWIGSDNVSVAEDPFSPTRVSTTLAPGESRRETFTLDTSDLTDNEYWVSGYAVANLAVSQSLRSVVIGDRVGHRRRSLVE